MTDATLCLRLIFKWEICTQLPFHIPFSDKELHLKQRDSCSAMFRCKRNAFIHCQTCFGAAIRTKHTVWIRLSLYNETERLVAHTYIFSVPYTEVVNVSKIYWNTVTLQKSFKWYHSVASVAFRDAGRGHRASMLMGLGLVKKIHFHLYW